MLAEATVKRHSQQIESMTPSLLCRWRNVGFVGRDIYGLARVFLALSGVSPIAPDVVCAILTICSHILIWRGYGERCERFLDTGVASSMSARTDSVKRGRFISLAMRAINFCPMSVTTVYGNRNPINPTFPQYGASSTGRCNTDLISLIHKCLP
jgi:hypothetical protein